MHRPNNFWSDEEKQYLKDNYNKKGYKEIAEHLGRTTGAVRRYLQKKGEKEAMGKKPTIHYPKPPKPPKERKPRNKTIPLKPEPIQRPPAVYSNKSGYLGTLEKYA